MSVARRRIYRHSHRSRRICSRSCSPPTSRRLSKRFRQSSGRRRRWMERLDEIAALVRDQQARSLPIELSHADADWLLQKISVLLKGEQTRQEIISTQKTELERRQARINL